MLSMAELKSQIKTDIKIENLISIAKEIADIRQEQFGSEDHVAWAMDLIVEGPAYLETDSIEEKLEKLTQRANAYVTYDWLLSKEGFAGNRQIDAARIRHETYKSHVEKDRLKLLLFLCQINGMFLGREVLNRSFTFFTHGPAFDLFVQKNPSKTIARQDDVNKIRLLLMPRGSFKSTADGIDCVQWIINFPDIRIMFLTASLELAKAFVGEVKGYFTVSEKSGLTPFQTIVGPGFLVDEGKEGKENEFICPRRSVGDQRKKEVTLWAGSVGSSKVGMHCEVLKADDAIDDKNTETPQLISKTNRRIGMALNLLDAGSYNENLGTPYAPNDWYSHVAKNIDNVLTLVRPCRWLKKDINGMTAIERGVQEKDLKDEHWVLLFSEDKYGAEKLSHRVLKAVQQRDPEGFPSQYLLDPSGYKKISFTNDLIQSRTVKPDQMPSQIEPFACYITWDLADTATAVSDYSVGSVFHVDREGRGYVVEIYRDRYATFSELCYAIAESNHKFKPSRIIIENARGAEKLKGDITRAAQDMGDKMIPLEFIKVDNTKQAKSIRIGKLEPKLKNGRLFFLNTIACYQELVEEFVNFGSSSHDDICDSIGFCEHFLDDVRPIPHDPLAAQAAQRIINQKAFDEMIYGGPEQYIDVPIDPLPDTETGGTGNDSAGDLWNPFGVSTIRR